MALLRRLSPIRELLASTGAQKTAKEKIEDRISNIYTNAQSILGSNYQTNLITTGLYEEVTDNAWQAACILVKFKKT